MTVGHAMLSVGGVEAGIDEGDDRQEEETVEGSTPHKHFARHRATSRLLGQQLLRDENAVRQRADVRIRNDDLWRELYIERLLDRERDALRLPLGPEPEVVRVARVLERLPVQNSGAIYHICPDVLVLGSLDCFPHVAKSIGKNP